MGKAHDILFSESKHILHLVGEIPIPSGCCLQIGTVNNDVYTAKPFNTNFLIRSNVGRIACWQVRHFVKWCWQKHYGKEKIHIQNWLCSTRDTFLLPAWQKRSSIINLPLDGWLILCLSFSLQEWCHIGSSMLVSVWRVRHSAVVVARLAMLLEPMHNLHSCDHNHFVHCSSEQTRSWQRKKADWYLWKVPFFPPDWLLRTSWTVTTYWRTLRWDTDMFILCAHSERLIHIFLYQVSFPSIFQSNSFQVLNSSAKPLATAHKSAQIYDSGHLWIQTMWTTRFTIPSSANRRIFLHCCPSGPSVNGA